MHTAKEVCQRTSTSLDMVLADVLIANTISLMFKLCSLNGVCPQYMGCNLQAVKLQIQFVSATVGIIALLIPIKSLKYIKNHLQHIFHGMFQANAY